MIDTIAKMLEWIDQYGADKLFMVLFFIMYMKSQRKLGRLQDTRYKDSREALQALIEAKLVFGEMSKGQKDISDRLDECCDDSKNLLTEVRAKLDTLITRKE